MQGPITILPITNFEIKKSLENLFMSEKVFSTFYKYYKLKRTWRKKLFNLLQLIIQLQVSNNEKLELNTCNWPLKWSYAELHDK